MKNKFIAWLIFIIAIGFFSACKKNNVAIALDATSVPIYECSPKTNIQYICFDSLLADSRCPAGVGCIWQGTALIKVSFHETTSIHKFIMSLKDYPSLGFTSDTTINGYRIIFTDLKPSPNINGTGDEKLRAYFSITH